MAEDGRVAVLAGPLKRVSGEEALIGPCSGSSTTAVPKPVPTIASGHCLRARGVVVATSFFSVHFCSPRVSTAPCLSNSITSFRSGEGRLPSIVSNLAKPYSLIGAFSRFGSVVGVKPPSAMMTMLPTRNWIACAAPAATSATIAPATIDVLNKIFRILTPLRSLDRQTTTVSLRESRGRRRSAPGGAAAGVPLLLRHPRRVLATAAVLLVGLGILGIGLEEKLSPTTLSIPGTSSERANRMLREHFGDSAPFVVLLRGPRGRGRPPGAGADPRAAPRSGGDHALALGPRLGPAPAARPAPGD